MASRSDASAGARVAPVGNGRPARLWLAFMAVCEMLWLGALVWLAWRS